MERFDAIKLRAEYAAAAEPGRGQDDLWWLIGEVDRLRATLGHEYDSHPSIVRRDRYANADRFVRSVEQVPSVRRRSNEAVVDESYVSTPMPDVLGE